MTDALSMLIFLGGFIAALALPFGIWGLCAWIAAQVKDRQERPQLEAQAAAQLADAERKLEEARIKRLELELGITTGRPDEVER